MPHPPALEGGGLTVQQRTVSVLIVFLFSIATSAGIGSQEPVAAAADSNLKVILLGTAAGPTTSPQRLGISTLVIAGPEKLLFDCGRSLTTGMARLEINPADVTKVFLTHLHSDHIVSLPELYLFPWASQGRHRAVASVGAGRNAVHGRSTCRTRSPLMCTFAATSTKSFPPRVSRSLRPTFAKASSTRRMASKSRRLPSTMGRSSRRSATVLTIEAARLHCPETQSPLRISSSSRRASTY